MSKKKTLASVNVTIELSSRPILAEALRLKYLTEEARNLVEEIKRHCDYDGDLSIESKYDATCEYCGNDWTEISDHYNGGCCGEDEEQQHPPVPGADQ